MSHCKASINRMKVKFLIRGCGDYFSAYDKSDNAGSLSFVQYSVKKRICEGS